MPFWLIPRLNFGKLKVAVVSPTEYRVGVANLGVHTLFRILNSLPDIFVDLFFLDRLRGLRTENPLGDFDLVLFSVSFELDYPNIAKILKKSGIPVRSEGRIRPFVVVGGIAPSANPIPLSLIADAIVIGEAESTLPKIIERFSYSKSEFVDALRELDFVYIPGLKEEATRSWERDVERFESISAFIDRDSVFGNMFLVEIMRGCPHKCRFCLLSYMTLPPRYRPLKPLLGLIASLPYGTPIGLVASAVADHPELIEFLENLPESVGFVTVSSLRIDRLSEKLLTLLKNKGLKTITVAPEAGTEKLRKIINKPIPEDVILEGVELAASIGFERLKIYFMIGLPHEDEDDVIGITELIHKIRARFTGHISITVSAFVPKPHTPFEDEPFMSLKELKRRARIIKVPRDVEISFDVSRNSELQAILSRGDRRIAEAVAISGEQELNLRTAFSQLGIDVEKYLNSKGYFESAPYKRIRTGVLRRFIEVERLKAQRAMPTPSCNLTTCKACGICR